MDSATLDQLAEWMRRQRWYGGKGNVPVPTVLTQWDVPTDDLDAHAFTLIVSDRSVDPSAIYQIPLVRRPRAQASAGDAAHIVAVAGNDVLTDAPHDGAFARALLRDATGVPAPSLPPEVLVGEQSNTSIIFRRNEQQPLIVKLFRRLHPGVNPDVELQSALSGAGSPFVAPFAGALTGQWPLDDGVVVSGPLAFGQQFFPGVDDAWRVSLHAARTDEDFADRARALGAATAGTHVALSRLFPTGESTADVRAAVRAAWARRLDIATMEVPALESMRPRIEAVYAAAGEVDWPDTQRIHGDLHLGQAILVPTRGWVLLDFEGEPMRPMVERLQRDLALRDVAGMLRSFDYVSGSLARDMPDHHNRVREWSERARSSFIEGYQITAGARVDGPLLDALELDKAVYEAIYEERNRPDWLPIPLAAIGRLVAI